MIGTTDYTNKKGAVPHLVKGKSPKERLPHLIKLFSLEASDDFDPDEISWVTPNLGVTDLIGAFDAADQGHFVINTAGEVNSNSHYKHIVDPRKGPETLKESLNKLTSVIHDQISDNEGTVVVHCYMGMERRVITVVWYLHRFHGLSIAEAYEKVGQVRPIAVDHSAWIEE